MAPLLSHIFFVLVAQERCSCNSLWRHIKDAVDQFVRENWLAARRTGRDLPGRHDRAGEQN